MGKAPAKRKRETAPEPRGSDTDPRLLDPYGLQMRPCKLADHQHQRKKSKAGAVPTMVMLKNCEHNPNCLYGLGEYQKGIWQSKKLVQRLLGDDPRELLRGPYPSPGNAEALADTTTTSVIVTAADTQDRLAPCGLRNLGATCYLNSMLQCLFVNRPFRKAVYDWEPKENNVSEQQILQMRALQRLFAAMQLGKKSVYDPQEFADTLSLNNVMQQDAQEFSKLLLAHLRGIFTHSRVAEHTELVDRLFQGQMQYVTKCLRCNTNSSRPSSYYEISLNIKGHKTVERCIESYLAPELLDGDNKYFCDQCNTKENAERFIDVVADKLPPVLMLQLMRFVYDAQAGRKKKLMDVIEVGETLNMTDVLRRCGNAGAFNTQQDAIYRLSGYLNHRGKSANVGHYTASVAHPSAPGSSGVGDWFEFDDNIVTSMAAVVDTEGAHEHQGKVIRSRDAYMLIYTRVDDAILQTASVKPSEICEDEINVYNTDFLEEVDEYQKRAKHLEMRIQERRKDYTTFFENGRPHPAPEATEYYWIDSQWLASWVSGEVYTAKPKTKSGDVPAHAEANGSNTIDLEESKTDGTDSDEQHDQAGDGNVGAIDVDDKQVATSPSSPPPASLLPVAMESADAVPFSQPMDIARFCCMHSCTQGGNHNLVVRFSPETTRQLKRVSASLFEHLQRTCGLALNGMAIQTAVVARLPVFSASTYRCATCETAFRGKLLEDANQLSEVGAELELLKSLVVPGESPTYLMSRAWMASYKSYLMQNQKSLQRAGKSNAKKPNNGLKSHFESELMETTNTHWQSMLNEDISCPHGGLILDKRKYKAVPLDTWLYFSEKFPVARVFENSAAEEPCPMCVVDRATTDEDSQKQRSMRDSVLSHGSLGRLYRRRVQSQSGSCLLNEIFVPLNASATPRKTSMFMVNASWMRAWRSYIRDLDRPGPEVLRCDELTCNHGKLLLPRTLVQIIKGKPIQFSDMDVEFVYPDELLHLGELYGMPDSRYYYGELLPSGQMQWKSCSLSALGEALSQGWGLPSDSYDDADSRSATCQECEDASEKMYQDALHNFENRIVHVQLLADDQPVPSSVTLVDESSSGRRRSKRIKTGSGSTWPIAANADDTVYVLKTKIFEETDLYPIRQRLFFRGDVLHDNRKLRECGIKAGDAVYMRLSEDVTEDLALADEGNEREVGFQDSVFVTRRPSASVAAVSMAAASVASSSSSSVWVCSACTYVNDASDDLCEMCSTLKAIEIE